MKEIKIYTLELVGKKSEYDSVFTFQFKPQEIVDFKAGQWVHLGFPLPNRDKSLVRHMSFASAPSDELMEFTMDISSGTLYKQRMEKLNIGECVNAFKIVGEFQVLPNEHDEIVFISGGIGITPVRSIVRQLIHEKSNVNWSLVHVSRDKFLYENQLSDFRNQQMRVNHKQLDNNWDMVIAKRVNAKYYLSGSERFISGISDRLKHSGVPTDKIIKESFH